MVVVIIEALFNPSALPHLDEAFLAFPKIRTRPDLSRAGLASGSQDADAWHRGGAQNDRRSPVTLSLDIYLLRARISSCLARRAALCKFSCAFSERFGIAR